MKRRKEFHLFPLGILLFTLTLTIVSGRIAIHAADLNTELPANDSTEISSEIPTETPVVPSTENPKPVLQGLIHDKNGHFYFYQNGKKLKNRWKKVGKNKYYFGKNGQYSFFPSSLNLNRRIRCCRRRCGRIPDRARRSSRRWPRRQKPC